MVKLRDPIPLPKLTGPEWDTSPSCLVQPPTLGNVGILLTWWDLSGAMSSRVFLCLLRGAEKASLGREKSKEAERELGRQPSLAVLSWVKPFPALGRWRLQVPGSRSPFFV